MLLWPALPVSVAAQRSAAAAGVTRPLASEYPMAPVHVVRWAGRTRPPIAERPRVGLGRIVLEMLAGVVGAWGGGALAYNVAANSANDHTVQGDAGYSPAGNWGYVVGSMLGSALGVYVVGSMGDVQGSALATALGAAVPSVALAANAQDAYMPLLGALFVAPLQAGGATLGFNLTRRRQRSSRATSP